jgi:hypothetical protein
MSNMDLGPYCDNDCVGEVAGVYEEDGYVTTCDHVSGGDRSRGGDVVKLHAQASYELDAGIANTTS